MPLASPVALIVLVVGAELGQIHIDLDAHEQWLIGRGRRREPTHPVCVSTVVRVPFLVLVHPPELAHMQLIVQGLNSNCVLDLILLEKLSQPRTLHVIDLFELFGRVVRWCSSVWGPHGAGILAGLASRAIIERLPLRLILCR